MRQYVRGQKEERLPTLLKVYAADTDATDFIREEIRRREKKQPSRPAKKTTKP